MTERPTTIIIFGITGDLAQKKLLPAMYDLYINKKLINTQIVGFSRRDFSQKEIRDFVKGILSSEKFDESFLELISYVQGQFDDKESYIKLSTHLADYCDKVLGNCSNKLFYLSVPPNLYEVICKNISLNGLSIPCGGDDGFARILIEKPFGKDLKTAQELDRLLGNLFREEQIYRIDHYVAKESILNIIDIKRRASSVSSKWNEDNIEKVEINLFEKNTVGLRGVFYDEVGAFRDVGQNHMLQILALLAMEVPKSLDPKLIQKARAKVLESLRKATEIDFKNMLRGQYEGYTEEPGVNKTSTTETFFSIKVWLEKGLLKNVPFILTSGKALSKNLIEIIVIFKNGQRLIITVPPEDSLPAYQKIFLDCISGDQTVFISTREIMAEWNFVTNIVKNVENLKPFIYKVGSNPKDLLDSK